GRGLPLGYWRIRETRFLATTCPGRESAIDQRLHARASNVANHNHDRTAWLEVSVIECRNFITSDGLYRMLIRRSSIWMCIAVQQLRKNNAGNCSRAISCLAQRDQTLCALPFEGVGRKVRIQKNISKNFECWPKLACGR